MCSHLTKMVEPHPVPLGLVYVGLPSGVSTLVLTWWGNAFCRLRMQPTGYGGVDRTLFTLPEVSSAGHRQKVIQIAVNDPAARLYVQTGPGNDTYNVGLTLIPVPLAWQSGDELTNQPLKEDI